MKLYYFPSPNPQKVQFALLELGMDCEIVPVDLTRGEHKKPEFLALNPCGRVPVLTDGDVTLWESLAILGYLGEKAGKLWPTTAGGRAQALKWLFYMSTHITPAATDLVFNRIAVRRLGLKGDDAAIERGLKALPGVLAVIEGHLAKNTWMMGSEFSLVDCGYCPVLNAIERAEFGWSDFPNIKRYLDALRARRGWQDTPKLPGL